MEFTRYSEINDYRLKEQALVSGNQQHLNCFHDFLYECVLSLSLHTVTQRFGTPPSHYTFFVMGSAGRMEQSLWSDQDHGIIFKANTTAANAYFLELGKEISDGLAQAGYPKCPGGVMAANPKWCKSEKKWIQQLESWGEDSTLESNRYLLIFADARSISGEHSLLENVKKGFLSKIHHEHLLKRLLQNTMNVKKGIGVLGQLLPETHGIYSGAINLKDTAFFPYVNAARLLALKEGITATPTLSRLKRISVQNLSLADQHFFTFNFINLLQFRLRHADHHDYQSGHYVFLERLSKLEKHELKEMLKAGEQFHTKARRLIDKDVKHGYE